MAAGATSSATSIVAAARFLPAARGERPAAATMKLGRKIATTQAAIRATKKHFGRIGCIGRR